MADQSFDTFRKGEDEEKMFISRWDEPRQDVTCRYSLYKQTKQALILSARDMARKERRQYGKK